MVDLWAVWCVARYEAKLLFRSWAFRIFTILGLTILVFMNIGLGTSIGSSPFFFHSFAGSLPLTNIKLLNIYQGIIAAFLATEFIKRDRRHDSTQVVLARSFSNVDYILGKVIGILAVFAVLNILVLAFGFVIHAFFSSSPFAWQPYILYPLLISLPTLVFIIGVSFVLITLLRSQAIVFVIMLGYSLLVLILLGPKLFCIFDSYAFYQPLVYSDFIGLGNTGEVLLLRGAYLLVGIGLISLTALTLKRLPQSQTGNVLAGALAVVCFATSLILGTVYMHDHYAQRDFREQLRNTSAAVVEIPTVMVTDCNLEIEHEGTVITGKASLAAVNHSQQPLDSLLFTLNPGLEVSKVTSATGDVAFTRNRHLLWIKPDAALLPDDSVALTIVYSGRVDSRYCYLDIDDERVEGYYQLWLYSIPKQYVQSETDCVQLTPEAGWYPIASLSPGTAFPAATTRDYAHYSLRVTVDEELTAISQGQTEIEQTDGNKTYTFRETSRLPQISLTIGRYDRREIVVDSIVYSLYTLPGHDFFSPYFDQITDTLPHLIRDLKNEYETALGFEYPYDKLDLVEVPLQFYSCRRLWTTAQEMVQPQIVFIPESGTLCAGVDFQQMKRRDEHRQERANQADSPLEIQARYFASFARTDLLGLEGSGWSVRNNPNIEPRMEIFPNFISYASQVSSARCPVLNYAFEAYFKDKVTVPEDPHWRSWLGLTDVERANLILQKQPLVNVISDSELEPGTIANVLEAKGGYLLTILEARVGEETFTSAIADFLTEHRFRNIHEEDLDAFAASLGQDNLAAIIDAWYRDTLLPGYLIDDIESYGVVDGERTRTQFKCRLTNPTTVDGVVALTLRYRMQRGGGMGWWMRMENDADFSQKLLIPAMSSRYVGLVLDDPLAEMTIDTYVSQNIPSLVSHHFRDQDLRQGAQPYSGDSLVSLGDTSPTEEGLVVDNEDSGFEIMSHTEESWLRTALLSLFGVKSSDDPYVGFNAWRPPSNWSATTDNQFFGRFIHSAYYKKSGDGDSKAAWNTRIDQAGDYDVYYYCEGQTHRPPMFRRPEPGRRMDSGEKHFLVYHEDGVEEISLDLNGVDDGWNHLGTFRLAEGANRIELTDQNELEYVTADAVKWVRH